MRNPEPLCDECGSAFFAAASPMAGLCAECASLLYGYPACLHEPASGRCRSCGWDGSAPAYRPGRAGLAAAAMPADARRTADS